MVESLDVPVRQAFSSLHSSSGDRWLLRDAIREGYLPPGSSPLDLTREVRERMVVEGKFTLYDADGSVAFSFPEASSFSAYRTYRH